MIKCNGKLYSLSDFVWALVIYLIMAACIVELVACVGKTVIHSAILPDEDQAQCESLGGRWSVNHQCYNAGEPTTIKKLKESLKTVNR